MTYIPVDQIFVHIPNKFEAIKVAALECRRLNDKLQAMEISETQKIATLAVERLMAGKVSYYDARERREQERSETMIAAAEEMLDMTAPSTKTLAELGVETEEKPSPESLGTAAKEAASATAAGESPAAASSEMEPEIAEKPALSAEAEKLERVEDVPEETKD